MPSTKPSKEERVLDSARAVFTRYGYARTTMADIASNAGISRPALYLLFRDKEAIFDRVVRELDRGKLAEIRAATAQDEDLRRKLMKACIAWGLHPVELAAANPDAADLFDLRFPAVRQAYENFVTMVADMIASEVAASGIGASSAEVARMLVFGMRGMRDAQDLRRMIEVQIDVVIRAIGRRPAETRPDTTRARR